MRTSNTSSNEMNETGDQFSPNVAVPSVSELPISGELTKLDASTRKSLSIQFQVDQQYPTVPTEVSQNFTTNDDPKRNIEFENRIRVTENELAMNQNNEKCFEHNTLRIKESTENGNEHHPTVFGTEFPHQPNIGYEN